MNAYIVDYIERDETYPKLAIMGPTINICENCSQDYLKEKNVN
jgi:hypothetical protein